MCRRYEVLPIGYSGGYLILAMVDPGNVFAIDDVRAATGQQVKCVVAERSDLRLRSIGFVFQRFFLLPMLTAAENVDVPQAGEEVHEGRRQLS